MIRLCAWVPLAGTLFAQLPLQYPVKTKTADLLRSDDAFRPLASQIRANVEPALQQKFDDLGARRELLATVMMLDLLDGRNDEARARMDEIRALETTPAAKAMSHLTTLAILDGSRFPRDSPAYRAAIDTGIRATLDALPFESIQKDVVALREKLSMPVDEAQIISQLSATLDPIIEKTGALPASVVHGLPGLRFSLQRELPVRAALREALSAYIAGHDAKR